MQNSRLFQIVYILLEKQTVTAKYLADRFEVSTRTIYRDIEALSSAGIPIYMSPGKGGGIRLLENFILNKAVLSEEEQSKILASLQGIQAATGNDEEGLLTKLSSLFQRQNESWIEVDFTDWSGKEQEKFQMIKSAILSRQVVQFQYYASNGRTSTRRVNPMKLYFRDKTWYFVGYCIERKAMRMFKLRRMKQVKMLTEQFDQALLPENDTIMFGNIKETGYETELVLWLDASQAYRVYDEFGEEEIQVNEDRSFTITVHFIEDEWVYGFLLSFGNHLKVLEPPHVQRIIRNKLMEALALYKGDFDV